ncbi:MAG: DUF5615 family PIN-like protein [Rhizonema sp. NSF051]|nr:DUF5615 family PIN-like protein [Rhizonema sp. NSF051]
MKFLIDVNASRTLGDWLKQIGHDVIYVTDTDSPMSDEKILDWAVVSGRIIVTTDNDFEQMIWQQRRLASGFSKPSKIYAICGVNALVFNVAMLFFTYAYR